MFHSQETDMRFKSSLQSSISKQNVYKTVVNTFSELQSSSDRSVSHVDTLVVLEDNDIKMRVDNVNKIINYEDFLFLDGFLVLKYSELQQIHTDWYKESIQKVRVGLDRIVAEKDDFEERGIILFRKQLKVPGNYQTEKVFQVVTIYFPATEAEEKPNAFKKEFWKKYLSCITRQTNPLKMQQYRVNQLIELQFYDKELKFNDNNPQALTYYTTVTKNGLVLSEERVYSPVTAQHSFRYSQVLSCRPEEAQKAKDKMPQDLAATYQPNDGCIGMTVDWNSEPFFDLLCSTYHKSYKYKVDRMILSATIFTSCFAEGMAEIVLEVKNTGNNLRKSQINQVRRQRFISILEEILKNDYNKYVDSDSNFYKNFMFLKPGCKQYIMDLMRGLLDTKQATMGASASYSAENKSEIRAARLLEEQASKYDIEDYSSRHFAKTSETSSIDLSNSISAKWAEYEKKYSAGYAETAQVNTETISAGNVTSQSQAEMTQSSQTQQIISEFERNSSSRQLSYQERSKLESFVQNNTAFFTYLKEKKQTVNAELIQNIASKSEQEVWDIYKRKLADPYFHFIYQKRWSRGRQESHRAQAQASQQISWKGTGMASSNYNMNEYKMNGATLRVKDYSPLNYNDLNGFNKKDTKCKTKGRNVGPDSVTEIYDEPPIIPSGNTLNRNVTIAVPSRKPGKPFDKVSSDLDKESEQPPMDDTGGQFESPSLLGEIGSSDGPLGASPQFGPKAKGGRSEVSKTCTQCIPECKSVYPKCKTCPNPDIPDDPNCNECKEDNPDFPYCRDIGGKVYPPCPDNKPSCCMEGRPNYPSCLCEDKSTLKQCCEKFPNKAKCSKPPPQCDPGDVCCNNPSDPSCSKKGETLLAEVSDSPSSGEEAGQGQAQGSPALMGEVAAPVPTDQPCKDASCANSTIGSPGSVGPKGGSISAPSIVKGQEPCIHPPCCTGPDDPRCKDTPTPQPPTQGVPSNPPSATPVPQKPRKVPKTVTPPKAEADYNEKIVIEIVTTSTKAMGSYTQPEVDGIHTVMSLKGKMAALLHQYLKQANASPQPDRMATMVAEGGLGKRKRM